MVRRFLPQTFIGNHDVTRITSRLTDSRHLSLAIALLCMLPGVPTVYYGDEWGLLAVKEDRVGGDDAIRPALATSVEPPSPRAAAVADLYRRLIGLRRQHPWLVDATIEAPDVLTNELLAVRLTSDTGALAVVLAVGDTPADVLVAIPQGTVVAGPGSASPHSRGTAVGAPSHSVTVISGA
jgi:glycosidase